MRHLTNDRYVQIITRHYDYDYMYSWCSMNYYVHYLHLHNEAKLHRYQANK